MGADQYCPNCGQPRALFPHICPPPDPRIMTELKAIREKLDAILEKCDLILA